MRLYIPCFSLITLKIKQLFYQQEWVYSRIAESSQWLDCRGSQFLVEQAVHTISFWGL